MAQVDAYTIARLISVSEPRISVFSSSAPSAVNGAVCLTVSRELPALVCNIALFLAAFTSWPMTHYWSRCLRAEDK